LKIIHCLNHYFPDSIGGCEVYTRALAKCQKNKGHDVSIVLPFVKAYEKKAFTSSYQHDGIQVYYFNEPSDPSNKEIHYGKIKPEGIRNFVQLAEELKPDVIHFQQTNRSIGFTAAHIEAVKHVRAKKILTCHLSSTTCNTGLLIYRKVQCSGTIKNFACTNCCLQTNLGIKPVLSEAATLLGLAASKTGFSDLLPAGKIKSLLSVANWAGRTKNELKQITSHVDQIVVVASWYRDVLLQNGVPGNKITWIPQTPVTNSTANVVKPASGRQGPLKIVFLGRVQHQKGVHLLIEAVNGFSQSEVNLFIHGKKETTSYYQACIAQSSRSANIFWEGGLAPEEVITKLASYHILCLPSTTSEMSPLVIQEAFAAGLPALASNTYGNREQVQHNHNGLLFEFNNLQSLSENIQRLVSEPQLLQLLSSNVTMPGNFEDSCKRYMQLYQ